MSDKYDSGDLDALVELIASRGWEIARQRVAEELERKRLDLERRTSGDFERGQVQALRMVLDIPGNLLEEIKAQLKK